MTPAPMCAEEQMTPGEAYVLLGLAQVRHLPVMRGKKLVGMISEKDLYADLADGAPGAALIKKGDSCKLEGLMSTDVVSIPSDASLAEVVDIFLEHRFGALPVVDGEELVGMLSIIDVLAAVRPLLE